MGKPSGSEVVVMDERVMQAAARAQPGVANLNVTKSSRVHIGPKFVSVTQNVDNTEVIKGRILGLELVSPQSSKRLRCSIAVFVCWALVVVCALSLLIIKLARPESTRLDLDIKESWYLRRPDWQALPDFGHLEFLDLPVRYVLLGHSAMEFCTNRYSCIKHVLRIQSDHQRRGWNDIGPNYLIGGNGLVFEGRGGNVLGAMVYTWNRKSVSVMFLGNYVNSHPDDAQFEHLKILLEELIRKRVLAENYTILGHCQVTGSIITPGPNLMDNLHRLEHWNPVNKTTCLRG